MQINVPKEDTVCVVFIEGNALKYSRHPPDNVILKTTIIHLELYELDRPFTMVLFKIKELCKTVSMHNVFVVFSGFNFLVLNEILPKIKLPTSFLISTKCSFWKKEKY